MLLTVKYPKTLSPVLVLIAFVALVPVQYPLPHAASANEYCLALADRRVRPTQVAPALLERCSALYPRNIELLAALGAAYETANAPSEAEITYQRALALDPDYADLRLKLGRLLLGRGAATEAARQAALALQVQPNRRALIDLQTAAEHVLRGWAR